MEIQFLFISRDYIISGSRGFMGGSSSLYVITLLILLAIGIVVVEMFLICHMISQDHVIKGSCDIMGGTLSRQVFNLSILVVIDIVLGEI